MRSNNNFSYEQHSQYSRRKHSKSDWAGPKIGESFNFNLDHYHRLPAQQKFYRMVKKILVSTCKHAGVIIGSEFKPNTKVQLSPFYTNYPSNAAAYAAMGSTAFIEYKSRVPEKLLTARLADYLENPSQADDLYVDSDIYKQVCANVAECVQTRLLIEDLSRIPNASSVEVNRLFEASQQPFKFDSVTEIVRAVIIYGDVLPDWRLQDLHPFTRTLLIDLTEVSWPFFRRISEAKSHQLIFLGSSWVLGVCRCLANYLPLPKTSESKKNEVLNDILGSEEDRKIQYRFQNNRPISSRSDEFPPINGKNPPAIFDAPKAADKIITALKSRERFKDHQGNISEDLGKTKKDDAEDLFKNFNNAINRAGGQASDWEDMQSDSVENHLRYSPFSEGPLQGSPTDGRSVSIKLSADLTTDGEIFDRPVELSEDSDAYNRLLKSAEPISKALKNSLYPNLEETPEIERFRTSGSFDPSRLALAEISAAIFRRNRMYEMADRRGKPVLLIACDGSGSLNANQMAMLKILAAAWLNSTAKTDIKVLAGLYHSGAIRKGLTGPLVQWMYHPRKTPAFSHLDALRAVVSLPDTGTGAQSDALSIAFMLNEAFQLARGRMVYLILISDCAWNKSFSTPKTGKEEVRSYFENISLEWKQKLHTTLVALGVSEETGFGDILDKVVRVSSEQLQNYSLVAEKIGLYVASCMRERKKRLSDEHR